MHGRGKWWVACQNLAEGQLVLVGNAEDINKRWAYRLGRVHCVHPQLRRGKEIVRLATIAVLKNSGSKEIDYVLRDVSKNAPHENVLFRYHKTCFLCCKLFNLRLFYV